MAELIREVMGIVVTLILLQIFYIIGIAFFDLFNRIEL